MALVGTGGAPEKAVSDTAWPGACWPPRLQGPTQPDPQRLAGFHAGAPIPVPQLASPWHPSRSCPSSLSHSCPASTLPRMVSAVGERDHSLSVLQSSLTFHSTHQQRPVGRASPSPSPHPAAVCTLGCTGHWGLIPELQEQSPCRSCWCGEGSERNRAFGSLGAPGTRPTAQTLPRWRVSLP